MTVPNVQPPWRTISMLAGACVAVALATTATLLAGTYTNGGITLTTPNYTVSVPLIHCEPHNDPTANTVTVSGIPTGSTVLLSFGFSSGVPNTSISQISQTFSNQAGTVAYSIPYPEDASSWPGTSGSSRSIVVAVGAAVTSPGGVTVKVNSKQWKIVCDPDNPDNPSAGGCTLGYWKQDQHFDSWIGYLPTDSFDTVFGVTSALDPPGPGGSLVNPTLLAALEVGGGDGGGGGQNGMARQAVAALLNASNSTVNYPMSVGQVIAAVQAAYLNGTFATAHALFENYNESMDADGNHLCPLN